VKILAPWFDSQRIWAGVVDLMGIHEAAYLQHCRAIAAEGEHDKGAVS
jgi:hypothetical protein